MLCGKSTGGSTGAETVCLLMTLDCVGSGADATGTAGSAGDAPLSILSNRPDEVPNAFDQRAKTAHTGACRVQGRGVWR